MYFGMHVYYYQAHEKCNTATSYYHLVWCFFLSTPKKVAESIILCTLFKATVNKQWSLLGGDGQISLVGLKVFGVVTTIGMCFGQSLVKVSGFGTWAHILVSDIQGGRLKSQGQQLALILYDLQELEISASILKPFSHRISVFLSWFYLNHPIIVSSPLAKFAG